MNTKTLAAQASNTKALREQADAAAAQAAEAQGLVMAAEDAERARAADALAERDHATVAGYNTRALDQHVADTHTALEDAIRGWDVTQALAAHLTAISARTWAYADVTGAASRLGRSTSGMSYPSTVQPDIVELVGILASRMAQEATDIARTIEEN